MQTLTIDNRNLILDNKKTGVSWTIELEEDIKTMKHESGQFINKVVSLLMDELNDGYDLNDDEKLNTKNVLIETFVKFLEIK